MSMGFEVKIVFSFCKLTKIATFYKISVKCHG